MNVWYGTVAVGIAAVCGTAFSQTVCEMSLPISPAISIPYGQNPVGTVHSRMSANNIVLTILPSNMYIAYTKDPEETSWHTTPQLIETLFEDNPPCLNWTPPCDEWYNHAFGSSLEFAVSDSILVVPTLDPELPDYTFYYMLAAYTKQAGEWVYSGLIRDTLSRPANNGFFDDINQIQEVQSNSRLAVSDSRVIIGSPGISVTSRGYGVIQIFNYDPQVSEWVIDDVITPPLAYNNFSGFGNFVISDGDRIATTFCASPGVCYAIVYGYDSVEPDQWGVEAIGQIGSIGLSAFSGDRVAIYYGGDQVRIYKINENEVIELEQQITVEVCNWMSSQWQQSIHGLILDGDSLLVALGNEHGNPPLPPPGLDESYAYHPGSFLVYTNTRFNGWTKTGSAYPPFRGYDIAPVGPQPAPRPFFNAADGLLAISYPVDTEIDIYDRDIFHYVDTINTRCLTDCIADVTGPSMDGVPDCIINSSDLNYFMSEWANENPAADITGPGLDGIPDGIVGVADLNYFLDAYINQTCTRKIN